MDKKDIIKNFVEKLKVMLKGFEESFKKAEEARKEAPGPMESHSDTTRNQKENEGNYFSNKISEVKDEIDFLQKLEKDNSERVEIGNLVEVENENKKSFYLISEKIGGLKYSSVTMISHSTPIAKNLIDRRVGDKISLVIGDNKMDIKIININ